MRIKDQVLDVIPFQWRTSSTEWILPAFVGLGVGVAIGAGVGLLLAPTTGEEARLRLREGAYRVKDKAAELAGRAKERAADAAEQAREQLAHS
jgi:gas vesicle protein